MGGREPTMHRFGKEGVRFTLVLVFVTLVMVFVTSTIQKRPTKQLVSSSIARFSPISLVPMNSSVSRLLCFKVRLCKGTKITPLHST